jgi:hypothetical protein
VPVQETYTETNADGTTSTKTRTVIQIQWFPVSGEVRHFFDDVLICASKGIPEYYARNLRPKDLKSLEAFRPDFLSGFKTERYTIGPKDSFNMAKKVMDGEIRELCRRAIGGDHQQVASVNTQHVGVTYKHILLPLWLASYRYRDGTYRVMVNGLTGSVLGDRPYSWVKITALVLTILAVILALFLLFKGMNKGTGGNRQRTSQIELKQSHMEWGFASEKARHGRGFHCKASRYVSPDVIHFRTKPASGVA